ncbi:acyltransferase family protein [Escherichia coli]|nr:acyltransferase family protein [Escherichia coli]
MKQKELWINQIKGLCICLVVIYHSVITFYPHLTTFQHPLSEVLSKCWIYFNLYLAPFRMPVFFFISGYLIRRYIDSVPWGNCLDKRIWNIFWVLALWGVVQWLALSALNQWLAPERDLSNASNAAYADSTGEFLHGMITASTSLWYLYALIVYFVVCKIFSRLALPLFALFVLMSVAVNFVPTPWWGMNSVIRNLLMASLLTVLAVGAWLFTISLLLSLVSIVVIMKLFYQYEQRFGMRSTSLLNVIGSNTIAIYTTHRILVEIFSLTLLAQMNAARWSPQVELTLLLVYPFVSLFLCTVAGLLVRKLSQRAFSDLLFSPPSLPAAVSYSR